jgi:phosphatidylglycerophosphatase A
MNKFSVFITTLFGVGFFPKAPGTAGTFFAMIIYYITAVVLNIDFAIIYISLLFITFASVYLIYKAENVLGHDSPKIVIDELIGYFVAVILLPKTLIVIFAAFIIFRFFDIKKPEPVNVSQKLPGGWGVVIDDVIAGIYTNLVLQIIVIIYKNQNFF